MKICFKCKCEKPLDDFYKHSKMADGHLNKCKECTKKDVHEHRHGDGREKVLAYDRLRSKINPKRKAEQLNRSAEYRKTHKKVKFAQSKLRSAVLSGQIEKLPCFVCGKSAEAHHPDYDKPLDVVWLCSSHHKQAHALVK